jgi:hypothetical protein
MYSRIDQSKAVKNGAKSLHTIKNKKMRIAPKA